MEELQIEIPVPTGVSASAVGMLLNIHTCLFTENDYNMYMYTVYKIKFQGSHMTSAVLLYL